MSASPAAWESMMQAEDLRHPGQLLARRDEAARMLGMSVDSLERHVMPEIQCVRVGRMVLIPVAALEAWIADRAERAGGGW
jgi:hypothetical protein